MSTRTARKPTLLTLLFSALFLSGCVNTDVVMTDPSRSYSPTQDVRLIFEEPQQPFKVIAIIEGNGGIYNNQSDVFKKLQKKAAKIGAHAIIPVSSESEYVPQMHTQNIDGSLLTLPGGTKQTVKVAALRFE